MQNKTWVKVCGLSREEDISYCYDKGVNAVGFLLQKKKESNSLDQLTMDRAKKLVAYTPKEMESCLLLHSEDTEQLKKIIKEIKPSMIQVQSSLNPYDLRTLSLLFPDILIAKTFSIKSNQHTNIDDLTQLINSYIETKAINFVLLDSKTEKKEEALERHMTGGFRQKLSKK